MLAAGARTELPLPGDRPGHHRRAARHAAARREGPGPGRRRSSARSSGSGRSAACSSRARAEVEQGLHALERKEFVRRERRSSVAGETAYVFRHVLVRDVAYGQIPRTRRADMHRLAAGWIEALAGDRPEDLADMVAHHYLSALELDRRHRAARTPSSACARARAASRPATASFALNAFAAAARFYARGARPLAGDGRRPAAASCSTTAALSSTRREAARKLCARQPTSSSTPARSSAAATALVTLADFYFFVEGQGQEASSDTSTWRSSSWPIGPPSRSKASALANRARFHMIADEGRGGHRDRARGTCHGRGAGARRPAGQRLNTIGRRASAERRPRRASRISRRALQIAPPHSFERLRALNNLASTLAELGDLTRAATSLAGAALEAARRHGHVVALAWVESQGLDQLYWHGEWDELLLARRARSLDDSSRAQYSVQVLDAHISGPAFGSRGAHCGAALEDSAPPLELARAEGDPQIVFPALATRARVLLECGQSPRAGRAADELLERWRRILRPHRGPVGRGAGTRSRGGSAEGSRAPGGTQRASSADALARGGRRSCSAATPSARPRIYAEIGAHADAALTRRTRGRAARLGGPARGGRGAARARARVLPRRRRRALRSRGRGRPRSQLVVVSVEIVVHETDRVGIGLLVARR